MKSFDFNLLKVLHSLLLTHSVTQTSIDMQMSPGAISHALNRLRALFSDQILVRSGNQLVPTQFARRLLPLSGEAINHIEHLYNAGMKHSLNEPQSYVETVRVRCQDVVELLLISPIQQKIANNYLKLDIRSVSGLSREEHIAGLYQRKFDLLLDTQAIVDRSLISTHLMTATQTIICREGHPRLSAIVSEEQLLHEQFVSNYDASELSRILQTPHIDVVHSTPYLLSRYGMVANTDYVTLSSLPVARYFQKIFHLQILMCDMPIEPVKVYMTYHHSLKNSPAITFLQKAFEERVTEYISQM